MIITISGKPGSGKNTVADKLAEELKLKRYSVGDFRRELAKKRKMTINELNELGEKEEFTDKEADKWQKNLNKEEDFIIDGRLSYHFITNSLKIFLDVSPEIGAKRIFEANRDEETFLNLDESIKYWYKRINSDIKRYKIYYNLDPYDFGNFDFILDTSNIDANQVTEKVLEYIKKNLNSLFTSN